MQYDLLQSPASKAHDRYAMSHGLDYTPAKRFMKAAWRTGVDIDIGESQQPGCVLTEPPELNSGLQSRDLDLILQWGAKLFFTFSNQMQHHIWMLRRYYLECLYEEIDTFMPRDLPNKKEVPLRSQFPAYLGIVRQTTIHFHDAGNDEVALAPNRWELPGHSVKSELRIVNKICRQPHPHGK